MPAIFFKSVPFDKALVTLAMESGVDGVVVPVDGGFAAYSGV